MLYFPKVTITKGKKGNVINRLVPHKLSIWQLPVTDSRQTNLFTVILTASGQDAQTDSAFNITLILYGKNNRPNSVKYLQQNM